MTGIVGGNGSGPRDRVPPATSSSTATPAPLTGPMPMPDTDTPKPTPDDQRLCRRVVRIINPYGLHQRVADRFSRTAKQYVSAVTVWNGEARADGKSLWDLILLVALPDTEVIIEVEGLDALKAIDPLAEILASPSGEDYAI